jgi:hypothetical protein
LRQFTPSLESVRKIFTLARFLAKFGGQRLVILEENGYGPLPHLFS